jgi:large subunit ribosomal protein L25
MSEAIKAVLRPRIGKGGARATRRGGQVPGVIYGEGEPTVTISLEPLAIQRELERPGFFGRVIELGVEGKKVRVLPRDVQRDVVTEKPIHLDFQRVGMNTRTRLRIPVRFLAHGESPGIKRGGVLNAVRREVEVTCNVNAIPEAIEISLKEMDIGDSVHINDITLPAGVKPVIARNFTIASIAPPSTGERAVPEAAAAEGEVPAEGEAVAGAEGAPAEGAAAPAAGAAAAKPGAAPAKGGAAAAKPGAAPAKGDAPKGGKGGKG